MKRTPQNASPVQHWRKAGSIFAVFFKFGFFTFGGSWSVIAQIQKEYVEKRGWITEEELLDFAALGRSLPGLMLGNASFMFGYYTAGLPGGIAALVGMSLPAILIMIGVVFIYTKIRDNPYVASIMTGVNAAVVPVILSVMVRMVKPALKDWICWLILIASAAICLFTNIPNFLVVMVAAALGLLISARRDET